MSTSAGSGYIYHRTREQPGPDPDSPPLTQIKFYLDRYKIKEALRIFFHENTLKLLRDEPDFMWDVIPMICRRLRGLCQYRFRVFEGCERMLCRIAVDENCNPKEVLISLLAEISQPSIASTQESNNEQFIEEDDNVFRAMIRPLEGTLLRMNDPSPRGENYRWVLKVLMRHIDNISLPQDYNLDGKKRLSSPNDPSAKRFIEVLPLVLSFIEDFSDFKPVCGSDYDMKASMPILTKSQIDEVLNCESTIGESSDVDDQEEKEEEDVKNLGVKEDYADFAFATNIELPQATITTNDNDTNNRSHGTLNSFDEDEDDLANFYDAHSPVRGDITDASVTALISLIQRPLTFLDLTNYCSDLRICANRCLYILLEQVPNLFAPIYERILDNNLFKSRSKSDHDNAADSSLESDYLSVEENSNYLNNNRANAKSAHQATSTLSLATCSYIFRCERAQNCPAVIDQSFPKILNHQILLFCYTPYIIALLERSEILAHEKGLLLLESILSLIERDSLDYRYLELFERSKLFKNLFQIMVYSHMCTNRRRAYDLFTSICDLLTYDCKVRVFRRIMCQSEQRPCVRAACIDQYRKHLTIIHKELANLHQQLSFVSAITNPPIPSDQSQSPHSNDSKRHHNSAQNLSNQGDSQSAPATILNDLTEDSGITTNSDDSSQSTLKSTAIDATQSQKQGCELMQEKHVSIAINNDIMRKINIWQARYKIIGGKTLVDFLDQCIRACLPESHCTDLVIENYELLLATLTIFRYLKLRKTVIKDEAEEKYLGTKRMKKTFFDPVRNAIAVIMAELKLHHEEIVTKHNTALLNATAAVAQANNTTNSIKKATNKTNPSKSKNSKKKSKGNNAQKSNGNTSNQTTPLRAAASSENFISTADSGTMLACASQDLSLTDGELMGPVEKYEAVIGHLRTEQGELDCINWVMCRLDLVESVLVRTCDLYNC